MEYSNGMHSLNGLQDLLDEAFEMLLGQWLFGLDDSVQVTVHQLHHHIELCLGFVQAQLIQSNNLQ